MLKRKCRKIPPFWNRAGNHAFFLLLISGLLAPSVWIESAAAQEVSAARYYGIKILSGLQEDQVFQRDAENTAAIDIRGQAYPFQDIHLQWRIWQRRQVLAGFEWRPIPLLPDGSWQVTIEKLPVGGPYTLELQLQDAKQTELAALKVGGLLVGDLWFMAGQSNMAGSGPMKDIEEPSAMVHVYSLADEWQVACDPLHVCSEAAADVYRTSYVSPTQRRPIPYQSRSELPAPVLGSGLGVAFGKLLYEHTKIPIGLMAGALGGTTMEQWSPARKDEGQNSLYGAMLRRIAEQGGRLKGIIWWQGESDAYNREIAQLYEAKLRGFIAAVRNDLHADDLPFYAVQLSTNGEGIKDEQAQGWNLVQDVQRRVLLETPHAGLVASLDQPKIDAHLTAGGYRAVGRRLAKAVLHDVYNAAEFQTGPRLAAVAYFKSLHGDGVRLSFANVNGPLLASPRVAGFSIRRPNGDNSGIYIQNVAIDPDKPTDILIHTGIQLSAFPDGLELWYGWGTAPFCNLTDRQDMALPMFGPVPLAKADE